MSYIPRNLLGTPIGGNITNSVVTNIDTQNLDEKYLNVTGDNMENNTLKFNTSEIKYVQDNDISGLQIKNNLSCLFTDLNDNPKFAILNNGISFQNQRGISLANPLNNNDVVNKSYSDNRTTDIQMNDKKLLMKTSQIFHHIDNDFDGIVHSNLNGTIFTDNTGVPKYGILNNAVSFQNQRGILVEDP